ncbi:MAG: hypothetical protein CL926_03150 [Deltaproteobacteria bacterium]|nr:hypothetical protein [Deltaproteobacteria bacterium]
MLGENDVFEAIYLGDTFEQIKIFVCHFFRLRGTVEILNDCLRDSMITESREFHRKDLSQIVCLLITPRHNPRFL